MDIEFLVECSTLTRDRRERVRYEVEHFASKKPTSSRYKKRTLCNSFIALNKAMTYHHLIGDVKQVKSYRNLLRVQIRFFSVRRKPYKALLFIK